MLVADWTDEDPEITQALSDFGRNSVPLYVYYAPDKGPILLPQILTYDIMQNLIK
jgi:thiol:disulfide interchange protein DsbD